MGARKNARETRDGVLPLPSRVSLARPVLSCARHFQASATQARKPPDLRICRVAFVRLGPDFSPTVVFDAHSCI